MAEFVRVGLAARGESGAEFMRLLAIEILAQQEIVREPREPADPAMPGAERCFDRGQCKGAALGNLQSHVARRLFQLIVRHDLVDHAEFEGFARREARVAEPDLLRLLLADQVFEVPGAEPGVEAPHHRPDLAEDRALLRDRDVAHDLQHVAAADRITVDRGDDGLLQALDRLVHVERRQDTGIKPCVLYTLLAAADAEEAVAGAGQDEHAGARLAPDGVDAVAHFVAHDGGEHVAVIGAVQRQRADRPVFLVEDRFVPRGAPVVRLGGSGLAIGCAGPQGHAAPEGGPGMIQELLPQAERIGAILKARGETVSVAESSTAGLISAALLAVGGASAYFMGGAVVYTPASRTELLRVTEAEFAAMTGITPSTEPYALLFARKIKERLDTTWSIGETGTAGPTGSRYGHAPGHSCVAVIGRVERAITVETGKADRVDNMRAFTVAALDLLEKTLG